MVRCTTMAKKTVRFDITAALGILKIVLDDTTSEQKLELVTLLRSVKLICRFLRVSLLQDVADSDAKNFQN